MKIFISVERSEDGSLLPEIKCVECSPGTQPSHDKSVCLRCNINPILKKELGDQQNRDQCGSGSRCLSGSKGVVGVIEKGICIPTNPEIETNYQVIYHIDLYLHCFSCKVLSISIEI